MSRIALPDSNNQWRDRQDGDRANPAFDVALGEKAALEQQTRATQRITALGEMTGGIAHDFRNILAIIESGLRLAERNAADPEKVRVCLAGIGEGVGRGLKLTSQLLAFAKRPALDAHAENANDLLRNLELFLKYGAGAGIRVVFDLSPDIPRCLIDPSEFNAAILNLVVNARDAMPDGGEIQISTEVQHLVDAEASSLAGLGAYVLVCVKDGGKGMSAEIARKIFDPYFTTKGEKGTGLGLAQVRAFMRQIGGHVSVRSEPGQGTTFDLLFPSQDGRPLVADDLWRQLDRWVNEGGAVGDGFLPRPQERTDGGRTSVTGTRQHAPLNPEKITMPTEQESRPVREAVGVFHSSEYLQNAIDELLSSGFHRAELSLLASEAAVEEKLGHRYEKVSALADDPAVPRAAYVSTEAIGGAEGGLIGGLMYVGAGVAIGAVVASGGTLAALIAAATFAGGAGGLIGTMLAKWVGDHHADYLQEQLDRGGLLLWVRTWNVEDEKRAADILKKHSGVDVHVHTLPAMA